MIEISLNCVDFRFFSQLFISAVLSDKLLDSDQSIDLINVSFEKVSRSESVKAPIDYNTPDRLSARDSLEELKRINPNRSVQMIAMNI